MSLHYPNKWDYTNSLIKYLEWERFCKEWRFAAPFFLYWWTCENYTGAYDLALTLAGIGIIIAVIGAYIVGYVRE